MRSGADEKCPVCNCTCGRVKLEDYATTLVTNGDVVIGDTTGDKKALVNISVVATAEVDKDNYRKPPSNRGHEKGFGRK